MPPAKSLKNPEWDEEPGEKSYHPSQAKREMDGKLTPLIIERREVIGRIEPGGDGMTMIPSAFLTIGEYIETQSPSSRNGMRIEFEYESSRYSIEVE